MNGTVLLLTVGGSHQPLVTAIQALQPTRVVFFCTDRDPATSRPGSRTQIDGKGMCINARPDDAAPTLPNIPMQCDLSSDAYALKIVPADDFDGSYRQMLSVFAQMRHIGDNPSDYPQL